jgi:tetratricopeptide (TPR) repeat protein
VGGLSTDPFLDSGEHGPSFPEDSTTLAPPSDSDEQSWIGRELTPVVPGYTITRTLGRGGMGVVYLATQQSLNRPVALKMIRADRDVEPIQLARFRAEAKSLARLRHPNVVQIHQVGEICGVPYFSLELLEGGTLAQRLAGAPMPPREAATLAATLARTLATVHQVGIVHRDLKPANVLFAADGTPKVADFGLAKRIEVDHGQTLSGHVMGTPSYMPPEQALGRTSRIGPPADIYALGAILYETLTGRPPFRGPSVSETLAQAAFGEPVPPSRLQPKVSRDLETICLKCLAKEPARRYDSADALADDLDRFLAGESIHARRTPAWERAAKWAWRRPAAAALIAVGLALALGMAGAGARYAAYRRGQDERLARLRLEAGDDLDRGLRQRADRLLIEAELTLTALQAKLRPEPRLADLQRRVAAALSDVQRRRAAAAAAAADRERFIRFGRLRDEALVLDGNAMILPDSLVSAGAPEATAATPAREPFPEMPAKTIRATAAAALEVFPPGTATGAAPVPLPAVLTDEERAEVEADRYLMLMVLSEAVARPAKGEDPRRQARQALELLDRAAALHAPTPTFHLRRAACLERLGEAAAAQHETEQAGRIAPADAFDHLLLGREQLRRGAPDLARSHFDAALRLRPSSFWAHCLLAVAELNSTPPRAAEARTELTVCLLQQPSYSWLYLLRGTAHGQMGALLAAAGRAPRSAALAAECEARFEDAEADFRKALELGLEKPLDYVLVMNRGAMRFQRGKWESAAADFEQAIALDPTRFNAYASLGQALRKLGRRDEAITRLGEAITRAPKLAALPRARALARLDPDPDRVDLPPDKAEAALEIEAVLRDLELAARLEPPGSRASAEDHTKRGRLLLARNRPGEALTAAEAALAVDSRAAAAHLVKLDALLRLERHGEVIDSCDAALARGTGTADLYRLRGMARLGRNDFSGAIEDLTMALVLHPDEPAEVRCARGWAHLLAGAPEVALHDFEAALRHDSSAAEGYAGRAAARVRLDRIHDAVADAEESLRRTEPALSPRLLYLTAQTYTQASVRALAAVARGGRRATGESLAYESRAADLLEQALEHTPAAGRPAFWRDVIARDPMLHPLWQNPRILRRFQFSPGDGRDPLTRHADKKQQ